MEHLYKSLGGWTYAFFDYWYHKGNRLIWKFLVFLFSKLREILALMDSAPVWKSLTHWNTKIVMPKTWWLTSSMLLMMSSFPWPDHWITGRKWAVRNFCEYCLISRMEEFGVDGIGRRKMLGKVSLSSWFTKSFIFFPSEITRTKISDVGDMTEIQQDRLWTSLEALYPAVLSAPESIPSIDTNFNEFAGEMKMTAKSSLAPEAVRTYSRNDF